MNSRLTQDFVYHFRKLPDHVRSTARKQYKLWKSNPRHPSLEFKKVESKFNVYSVRVSIGWRALGILRDDGVVWFWVGSHAEYDKMLKSFRGM